MCIIHCSRLCIKDSLKKLLNKLKGIKNSPLESSLGKFKQVSL